MTQQEETTLNMTAMLDAVKASDETDTTKSRSTPPTSDTASSSSTLNDESEVVHQYDDATLTQLARQLEYYFSKANLERDTYVETLRQLNDGCVPVMILQRFQKVQAFTPIESADAIIKAATEFTSLLEVVSIDTKTGKRVEEELPVGSNSILAVGTISGKPLDNEGLQGVVPSTPKSPTQNTIIIREVDTRVTEEEVRALFDDEHCPPIQSLYLDVFNCWFVTLDTTSRDDMLYAMMQLRTQYLGDEPVKARLKSSVRQVDPTHAPGLPILTPVSSYSQLSNLSQSGKGNKRKQKRRSKNNTNHQGGKTVDVQQVRKSLPPQPKPDFSEESFPALCGDTRKVEVVVDAIESSAPNVVASDTCSTVTTLSSSSGNKQMGGYAAALLNAKPTNPPGKFESFDGKSIGDADAIDGTGEVPVETAKASKQSLAVTPSAAAQVALKPPSWGGGRSFADVLAM